MSDKIVLYELAALDGTRFSPFCWRTRWGLRHKGLQFESVQIGFPDIGELGGKRRTVPVIRVGDTFVEDSWDIAEFLDERFPDRPPLFGCSLGKGVARFVECFTDKVIHPTMLRLVSRDVFDLMNPHDQGYFRRTREVILAPRSKKPKRNASRSFRRSGRRFTRSVSRFSDSRGSAGMLLAMPTTSCSRRSSGEGSRVRSGYCWRVIRSSSGSSAVFVFTMASERRCIRITAVRGSTASDTGRKFRQRSDGVWARPMRTRQEPGVSIREYASMMRKAQT